MKYTCSKTPSMFRKCDNIFLLCNVTHLRLGLGKLFMLGIHETWTFFPPNQKELKTKIEPAFSLILYLCSFLFMIQYDGRKMDRHFEKKLIWELLLHNIRWLFQISVARGWKWTRPKRNTFVSIIGQNIYAWRNELLGITVNQGYQFVNRVSEIISS